MTTRLVNIDVPPAERQLYVALLELDAPWTSAAPVERALAAIEQLGLDLTRASADLEETWIPYDRAAVAAAVWPGTRNRTAVALASADGARRATVGRYVPKGGPTVHRNTVTVTLPAADVEARGLEGVASIVARLIDALPGFSFGTASAANAVRFPPLLDEPQPPPPFVQTAWLQVVGPRTSTPDGAAHLLAAPVRTAPGAGGTIWLWAYDDPMRYDTEQAIDGMRALSRHLRGAP
ncbi:hypothetical protein [Sorangium sp. So ce542]|uniref:hypothetical protein n=1 Tax=Sorangium sp. So ce542 TaxID=3133316 RepID=UPI003F609107